MSASRKAKQIFFEALEIESSDDVRKFIEESCAGDLELQHRVEELLNGYRKAGRFLGGDPQDTSSHTSVNASEMVGESIGPYKIQEQIGEGGMGVVYVAEQTRPVQRMVALKIIKAGMDTKEVIARFDAERQALAFMEHPNIARVLDAGATESGRSYFVMELVRGIPITDYCDQLRLSPRERLELFTTVCDAVQHAHQKGIIHRDIKPSNVLVTQVGAKPVVKVIDFGLAKATSGQRLTDKTLYTGFMRLMGTPVYMSPEQVGLSGLDVDTRADVYSLGILLYELLTGTTPLDKTEIHKHAYEELCRQVREVEAPKPSARISTLVDEKQTAIAHNRHVEAKGLRQLLDGDLDLVVLKSLEKDRDRRYSTPQDLSADIERFLIGKPVQAVPPSALYIARKALRRHKVAILIAATFLTLLILATVFSVWQAIRATKAEHTAQSERDAAVAARQEAQDAEDKAVAARQRAVESEEQALGAERRAVASLYVANMQLASQIWNSADGNQREIEQLLAAWIPVNDQEPNLREFSWRYQWSLLHQNARQVLTDTRGVTLSPEGNLVTADANGLRVWSEADGLSTRRWSGDTTRTVLSSDGRWAAIGTQHVMQLIDIGAGQVVRRLDGTECYFSSNSRFLASWRRRGNIRVFDLHDDPSKPVDSIRQSALQRNPQQRNFVLAPDGKSFLLKGFNFADTASFDVMASLNGRSDPVSWRHLSPLGSCAWSPDGTLVAVGVENGKIHLYRVAQPESQIIFGTHGKQTTFLAFSPDSRILASGGNDGTIDLWEVSRLKDANRDTTVSPRSAGRPPERMRSLKAHVGAIRSIVFSADGTSFASFDSQGVSKLWDVEDRDSAIQVADLGENLFGGFTGIQFEATQEGLTITRVLPGYPAALSGRVKVGDRVLRVSDSSNATPINVDRMQPRDAYHLIESGPLGSAIRLHMDRGEQGEEVVELTRHLSRNIALGRVAFSPDSRHLAIASHVVGATVLDVENGQARRYPALGFSVAFSPDGRYMAMDSLWKVVLWDLTQDRHIDLEIGWFPIHSLKMGGSLAFSPDSKYLAIGTGFPFNHRPKPSELKVWDLDRLTAIGDPLFKSKHVLAAVSFTPDGRRLVVAGHDGAIRIWDTTTWKLERTIEIARTDAMDISLDGRMLAVGRHWGGIDLMDFGTGDHIRDLGGHRAAGLVFSPDRRTLVSGSQDHNVVLWNVATGKQLRIQDEHDAMVFATTFSPDGNMLATTDQEGVLRIWKAASLEEIDRHPLTISCLMRLGQQQVQKREFAKAEATLRFVLSQQLKTPRAAQDAIDQTRSQIATALKGQSKLPAISSGPRSQAVALGDEASFRISVGDGPHSAIQWFHDDRRIAGANETVLRLPAVTKKELGRYHATVFIEGDEDVATSRSKTAYLIDRNDPVVRGGLQCEVYNNITGETVAELTGSPRFPNQPNSSTVIDSWEIPSDTGDHYGARITGYVVPKETGSYVFYLCSDDDSQLYLSRDESPENKSLIAVIQKLYEPRDWQGLAAESISAPIHLEAGQRYWTETRFKEHRGNDHLAVTWQMPDHPPPQNGDPPIGGEFLEHIVE